MNRKLKASSKTLKVFINKIISLRVAVMLPLSNS